MPPLPPLAWRQTPVMLKYARLAILNTNLLQLQRCTVAKKNSVKLVPKNIRTG